MKTRRQIDSLQAVRAVAFMSIYLYHAIRTFPSGDFLYFYFAKSQGPWGVSVFFILSGFVMTYAYRDRPPQRSLKNALLFSAGRIRRLYPLHLLMLAAGVVYWRMLGKSMIGMLKRLPAHILLIQSWFPVGYMAINSVAWYLSAIAFLYFCFPFLLGALRRVRGRRAALAGITFIFAAQLLAGFLASRFPKADLQWITYCHPLFRLGDFAVGGLLALLYLNRRTEGEGSFRAKLGYSALEIVAVVINVLVCVFYTQYGKHCRWFSYTALFLPATSLFVYVFSLNRGRLSGLLINRLTFWLAAISPYAFLIHRLVVYYFHALTKRVLHLGHVNWIAVVLVPFVLTVLAVYLYLALEKKLNLHRRAPSEQNA